MKVFFPFSHVLAGDIEKARQRIPAMKEGKTEICVIGANMDDGVVAKVFATYTCVSRVYTLNADGMRVHVSDRDEPVACSWNAPESILEDGDWIWARSAPAATLGCLMPFIKAARNHAVVSLVL